MKNIEQEGDGEAYEAAEVCVCNACGTRARRPEARFCATCGLGLGVEYFPTDSLRASYRFEQRPRVAYKSTALSGSGASHGARRLFERRRVPRVRIERGVMPTRSENGAAALALAFVTYALVPYLGILFCPGALVCGGVGLVRAWRSPRAGQARAAMMALGLGMLILCAQLLLWWILYKVPEWSRGAPF
ncbi:MAG: hypothetical protein QOE46_2644 [Acidobacteriota bacterium]|nr:hypothetical protein [Acidobacteriota bacterium]